MANENERVDHSPDEAQVESNKRATNARTLSADEALSALTGGKGAPSTDDFEPDSSGLRWQPSDEEVEMDEAEETTDDDVDSSTEDTEDSDENEETDDEETAETDADEGESSDESEPDGLGDFLIGLGEDGDFEVTPASADDVPPAAPAAKLTDADRVRMWQSTADKRAEKISKLEGDLTAAISERDALQAQLAQMTAQAGAKPFDKRPKDFIDDGEEFVREDMYDSSTPSGQAYQRYAAEYKKHEKEQLLAEVEARQEAKRQREMQQTAYKQQVNYLRAKRPNDFRTEDDIKELAEWAMNAGEKSLFYVSVARDLARGTFKLPAPVLKQLASKLTPNGNGNGNGRKSVATKTDATTPKPKRVDSDIKTLQNAGFLDAREGY